MARNIERVLSQVATEAPSAAADSEFTNAEKFVTEENAKRTGVGTRMKVGRTRGKGSIVIKYEQFDESLPETLPNSILLKIYVLIEVMCSLVITIFMVVVVINYEKQASKMELTIKV